MMWALKRTVSLRRFFEHPKHMLKLMAKKIYTILRSIFFLTKPMGALWKFFAVKLVAFVCF